MITDFIYYWREYGFGWAWLYLQVGSEQIDRRLALEDNECWSFLDGSQCDCYELAG